MPRRAIRSARALACAGLLLGLPGCSWLGLAWGALRYPSARAGESENAVVAGDTAYVARGAAGIEIVPLGAPGERRTLPLAAGESADDLAVADGLLFALDALPPGALSVYSLADPAAPALRQAPLPVPVGPFSGVSAAAGLVAVSGGTSELTLRRYAPDGSLGAETALADLGRGQPDVLLARDGRHAYVSTHEWGPHFSLAVAELSAAPLGLAKLAALPLETYGFTPGGAKPASFPIECALAGERLLVAHAAGLAAIDVSDPAAPRLERVQDLGVLPVNVDAEGGVAAVVGSWPEPGLVLVDLGDPARLRVLRRVALPPGSRPTGVALARARVVVAAGPAGTLVFERATLAPVGGEVRGAAEALR